MADSTGNGRSDRKRQRRLEFHWNYRFVSSLRQQRKTQETDGLPKARCAAGETAPAANNTNAEPDWHYHSTYCNSPTPCENAGKATGLPYKCEMGLPGALLPFYLYVWY